MISQLAKLDPKRLGVIARTSAIQYKAANKTIGEIAQELNVDYVLEGSVRRDGKRVRITTQLIETRAQTHCGPAATTRPARCSQCAIRSGTAGWQSAGPELLPEDSSKSLL